MTHWHWPPSLRLRLLGITLLSLTLALTGAHWWLSSLFHDHVLRQFDTTLIQQLDQFTARLELDAQGQPHIGSRGLSDPRWERPYSGLYWQIDSLNADGQTRSGVLRSRSLWDAELKLRYDSLADGGIHIHDDTGPRGEALRVVERSVQIAEQPQARWRLMVASDTRGMVEAVSRFNGVLAASLAALGALLTLVSLAQVSIGLSPLQKMQHALHDIRQGRAQRLAGQFPAEVQPLIDDFNGVLDRNAEIVARARTQAGNLAHALKTPLAVLGNAAQQTRPSELGALVAEQVHTAQRHIDWHLARARAAGNQHLPGQRTRLSPLLTGLLRVMAKVHADRHLNLSIEGLATDTAFAGEEQDLQEMLGNLLDNACRSARAKVQVQVQHDKRWLHITVNDDGPGIAPGQREAVLQRGIRLDESKPGSGLGLAIVLELAQLYGGQLTLNASEQGGLSAQLSVPVAPQDGAARQ